MSKWLDLSNASNKFNQSYFRGFVDISGGSMNLRNDGSLNIYDSRGIDKPNFSIKSSQMTIYDGVGTYYDISNSKLIYLKNLTSDVQSQINSLSQLTQLSINNSLSVGTNTSIGGNASIGGNLSIGSTFTTTSDAFVGGNIFIQGTTNLANANIITANIGTANITSANLTSLTVNGNIITGGPTSTSTTTIDTWTNTNLVSPPPAIVFGTAQSTSSGIYIPWTYPTQVNVGFLNLFLPVLNSFSCTYTAKVSGSLSANNPIVTAQTSSSYINPYPNNGTTYITGIVLTNVNANTGIQYIQFPQDTAGSKRYAYVHYSSTFASLTADPSNSLTAWYSNYSTTTNKSTVSFNIFVQAGPPSAPGQPTFGTQSLSSYTVTVPVSYTAPTYADSVNTTGSTAVIQNYQITYGSTGSQRRYGGAIADASRNSVVGTATSANITGLYPDCSYSVYVSAQNNSTYTSYGPFSAAAVVSTTNLLQIASMGSLAFGGTNYSARLVSTSGSVTTLYLSGTLTPPLVSSPFTSPIHAVANRAGSSTTYPTGLLDISAMLVRGGTTIDSGPLLTYGGYPANTSYPGAANKTTGYITITGSTPTDSYSNNYQQGFYLQSSSTVSLGASCFTASNSQSTVSLIQNQKNGGATTSTTTFNYYYDTLAGTPTSVTTQHYLNGTQSAAASQISGVWILNGNAGISITGNTTAANMGQYFYPTGTVVSYSTGATESNLTNLVAGSTTSGAFNSSISFSNTGLSYTNASYASTIPFTATAYNILGASSAATATAIAAVIDYPSYNLINSVFATSIATMTTSNAAGYRVYSAPPQTSTNIPTCLYNGTTRYSTVPYSNSWSLTSENNSGYDGTQELMVANGYIRSYDTTYLKSYTSFYYGSTSQNTANYSTISNTGYRYATFAWRVSSSLSGTNQTLNIVLNNVSNSSNNGSLLYADASNKLLLFFRVEDATSTSTSNLGSGNGTVSTYWISANDNTGLAGAASANNYFIVPSGNNPYFVSPTISNGSNITVSVKMPFSLSTNLTCVSSGNTYIYVRLGLPMNVTNTYNLRYVSAYLSA